MNDETRDDCVQELERINREIETIRHEVKQEQRRLSCYQTVQTNDKNTVPDFSVSKPETAGKHVDSSSYGLSPCTDSTKIYSQARKYVVDNSKPRTDLEYDPLSNFSANLCSYSSSCKEQKVKKDQGLKRLRNNPPDDSNEDDMLIIDIPLSPEKKRGRAEKLDCVDGKSQDAEEELKKANTVPVLLNSPPSCFVNAELSEDTSGSKVKANKVDDNCDAENSSAKYIVNICENKEFEITPGKSVVDLTGCLEDRRSESQGSTCFQVTEAEVENSAQPTGLSATADQQDLNWNNLVVEEERNTSQVEWSQWELPCSAEKMNPLQPCDFPLKNSLVRKAPFAHSDSPCRQQGEYAQTTEQPALNNDQNHQPPRKMLQSLVPESQKMLSKGQIQSKAVIHHTSSVSGSSQFQAQVLSSSVDLNLTNRAEADNEEVIIISSSSDEEEEFNYSEVELSDSDPEEECYRIFMEANNEEKRNEELPSTSPVSTRRKLKQQCEASKDKVPHDVRQHYVNLFTKEFIKTTATVNDAFQKALAEERTVYNRSGNKLRYQSVAVNALKRLRNQSVAAAKGNSQRSKGNVPLNPKKFKGNDDAALYESLMDYILTEEKMIESNYPVQHPEKPGCAVLFADNKKGNTDPLKRICCRCGTTYSVSQTGKHVRKEECNYHYGKGVENKVPGGVETRYSCCDAVMGAPGCQVFKLHVDNSLSLDGFVSTGPRSFSDTGCPGIYSLDCETCYTIHGLELSRVTVVNSSLQVIYDTFVRPDSEVIDYNTRFSGINEEDVKGIHTSLREVQETLLSFIHADTILIGHGLEADLCALKLLHGTVVDISVVFPHRLGPPHRLTLKNLTAEYLRRIIQESVCGHDTAEDATACMELMLWKVKEDGKLKK
uniref:RNA exonuclease 1 homolog n=1 Tax=Mastacembelus armatus TaxID=205130 RepID=A0A3Q3LH54_9TELE